MDTKLRPATSSDIDRIAAILKQAVLQLEHHGIRQWDELYPTVDDVSSDIDDQTLFVLAQEKEIAAVITLNETQEDEYKNGRWTFLDGRIAVIHRLCVDTRYQNQGIAKTIMLLAEKQLHENGYSAIRLDVFSQNPFAIKLYESLGYARVGEVLFRKGKFYLYEKSLGTPATTKAATQ